ncbi:2-dehydropantoate 2-reductase [Paenibacillus sp. HWE-109]|uniref:ketopantoate reductase family protein n=1 Tax=Paenibacillus sp. HWE-109 TaxID=1306526 RepID=UPI001EDD4613|nr:2-dehydropantoate 2-reductase [Paenibacillus sp. HWE-109]UKS30292.1 2-dehydropantoate 2-reductase [Paenibacillus sp. HWE-109]
MRIMIVGAGSLGLLYAAKLAAYCERLTVITRTRAQAGELAGQGLEFNDADGRQKIKQNESLEFGYFIEEVQTAAVAENGKPYDYIFLMVKQPAITKELVDYLDNHMDERTYLICFQNGVGHEEMLGEVIDSHRLLLAVTTEGARRDGFTRVSHTGHGVTYIGTMQHSEEIDPSAHFLLVELLGKAGFQSEMSKNMDVRIWSKLIINAVINPLTAIMRVTNGELLRTASSMSLMEALYQEACAVALAQGVALPDRLWESLLGVCTATSQNHSSMLQDIENSRPTEIDRINGSLLAIANKLNMKLPTHETVYLLVKALE